MAKVAIITGAGSGLGQATALRLAEEGINIAVVDVNETGGNETVELVKKLGVDAFFVKADVSKLEDVKNYVEKTVEKFGTIDYFFNNAGISGSGKYFLETSPEDIEQIVGINLLGALYGARHCRHDEKFSRRIRKRWPTCTHNHKNLLFSASEAGAKANGADFYQYLIKLLTELTNLPNQQQPKLLQVFMPWSANIQATCAKIKAA